ncbi:MAG: ABC-2 transporter permease [Ruminococcus sp.]|uniref:ABC-2 transporter permease n=1 Tax=Ruminococcus sp. TaxID=41978 RepID=UPI0025EF9BF0|nr:ABC-2 transporter permease [Ruminococcus sp.]MCR5539562.1 ABC-2 transporter permease [Ruminococcus sp.]
MTGLTYKEFKQNLKPIIATFVLPALIAYLFCSVVLNEMIISDLESVLGTIRDGKYTMVWLSFLLIAFVAGAFCQGMIFSGDDRKLWAYFVASSPDGIKGYIRIKYELTFIMVLLTTFSLQIGSWIMLLICASNNTDWYNFTAYIILLSFIQLLLRGIEIPFTLRFGVRNGSTIKLILFVILAIVFVVFYMGYPEEITEFLWDGGKILDTLLSFLPVVSIVAYYLSYRLSCRIYMRGADGYDK